VGFLKTKNMEYKLIIAQNTPGKSGADWGELVEEIEDKINRVFAAVDSFQKFKLSAEQWKLVLIGGITSTFETTKVDACLTLTQAIMIPKVVATYLMEKEEEDGIKNRCFRF
jgi:hypothetical protein